MTNGDRQGLGDFDTLYRAMAQELFIRALRSTGRDRAMAQDLVQETFQEAWQIWPTLATWPRSRQRAWLYVVLRNRTVSWYRKTLREVVTDEWDMIDSHPCNPTAELTSSELTNILIDQCIAEIEKMPARRRAVLELSLDGCSTAEIAALLSVKSTTVRDHYWAGVHDLALRLGVADDPAGEPSHEFDRGTK